MSAKGSKATADDILAENGQNLDGKVVLITGGNNGIGLETSRSFAKVGATVVMLGRSQSNLDIAVKDITTTCPNAKLATILMDLCDIDSVKRAAEEVLAKYPVVHILINNAGLPMMPYTKNAAGYEMQFATDHLGHFAFTGLIYKSLVAGSGRIVNVSSKLHTKGNKRLRLDDLTYVKNPKEYNNMVAYQQSKLCNVYFASELNKRAKERNEAVTAYSLHPGVVRTNIWKGQGVMITMVGILGMPFMKTVQQAAACSAFCATSPDAVPGAYHMDCKVAEPAECAKHPEDGEKLWAVSQELTGVVF